MVFSEREFLLRKSGKTDTPSRRRLKWNGIIPSTSWLSLIFPTSCAFHSSREIQQGSVDLEFCIQFLA